MAEGYGGDLQIASVQLTQRLHDYRTITPPTRTLRLVRFPVDKMTFCSSERLDVMARRVMFVQLKTGYGTDQGPAWISWVRFNRSWRTAYWHDRTLRRWPGMFDANFVDVETGKQFWLSGPHRDRGDVRYSNIKPTIDGDVRDVYEKFLGGAALPGRERG
jgi:hypothetical protein